MLLKEGRGGSGTKGCDFHCCVARWTTDAAVQHDAGVDAEQPKTDVNDATQREQVVQPQPPLLQPPPQLSTEGHVNVSEAELLGAKDWWNGRAKITAAVSPPRINNATFLFIHIPKTAG